MKSIIAITVAVLFLGACSDNPPAAQPDGSGGNPNTSSSGAPGGGDPSGAPGGGAPGTGGTAQDKNACTNITARLSDWGLAFANAAAGLGSAGSDKAKIETVVNDTKAANAKFAGELRAEAGKTSDAEVKKVANDLAAALDKINGQLDPNKVAEDPNVLLSAFDLPEYAAAADAYEKVCAG
jgi:hypothetical protein